MYKCWKHNKNHEHVGHSATSKRSHQEDIMDVTDSGGKPFGSVGVWYCATPQKPCPGAP
jgi:hypothetical protein